MSVENINYVGPAPFAADLSGFPPEPRSGLSFSNVLNAAEGLAGLIPGLSNEFSSMFSSLESLVQQQAAIQVAMQEVSFKSNISKSDHEMRMSPIRNLRLN